MAVPPEESWDCSVKLGSLPAHKPSPLALVVVVVVVEVVDVCGGVLSVCVVVVVSVVFVTVPL